VVGAMSQKGDRVGSITTTLGLAESKSHNISNTVNTTDTSAERGEKYIVEFTKKNGTKEVSGPICEFEVQIVNSQDRFTIPKRVIDANDEIVPGRTLKVDLYEVKKPKRQVLEDDSAVLDRITAESDRTNSDGVGSTLRSETVYKWLDDQFKQVKFRNARTQKESVVEVSRNKTRNGFTFPVDSRKEMDTKQGDLIEVITVEQDSEKNPEELIKEMHSMMMEMYNAYLEQDD